MSDLKNQFAIAYNYGYMSALIEAKQRELELSIKKHELTAQAVKCFVDKSPFAGIDFSKYVTVKTPEEKAKEQAELNARLEAIAVLQAHVKDAIKDMSNDDRVSFWSGVFEEYCQYCGIKDDNCYCVRDD